MIDSRLVLETAEYYEILDWLSENMPDEVNDPARGNERLSDVVIRLMNRLLNLTYRSGELERIE